MFSDLASAAVTLFVTIDPIGNLPVFISVTAGMTALERRATAIQATIIATGVLVAFALFGSHLLGFMGISIDAFRIAGGLLLFWTAFQMVFGDKQEAQDDTVKRINADQVTHIAIVPLAIPLMSGPGSISATILLSSHSPSLFAHAGLLIIIVAIMAIGLAVFMMSGPINRMIGKTGANVLTRLLGVLLAALSVQFVIDGVLAVTGGTVTGP
jgi:multiple antibiotic resistance protein